MQEEEIKILSSLFLIANSWLQAFALIKPLDSLWMCNTVLEAWAYCVPFSTPAESKSHLSMSSKLCLHIFYLTSVGKEGQDFDQQWKWSHSVMSDSLWPHGL